jgi:hypothetical protein
MSALKPLLAKAKKTDHKKFNEVIDGLLNTDEESGTTVIQKIFPASSIFSTILSLVGNLVITERGITRSDLDAFAQRMQQFFVQYEKLNDINQQFSVQIQRLLEKSEELKEDLKEFTLDCITTMNRSITKEMLKEKTIESLIQKFYDPQKIQSWLDTTEIHDQLIYPADAATSVKFLTSSIKKLQREFENIYEDNYKQLKELIASLKTNISTIDQKQLEKTNSEIERLYIDSRQADVINMNLALVDERMNTVCKLINMGR